MLLGHSATSKPSASSLSANSPSSSLYVSCPSSSLQTAHHLSINCPSSFSVNSTSSVSSVNSPSSPFFQLPLSLSTPLHLSVNSLSSPLSVNSPSSYTRVNLKVRSHKKSSYTYLPSIHANFLKYPPWALMQQVMHWNQLFHTSDHVTLSMLSIAHVKVQMGSWGLS